MRPQTTHDPRQVQQSYRSRIMNDFLAWHQAQIDKVIRSLGADSYDRILPETHALPLVIQPKETIEGLVYGRYEYESPTGIDIGRGVLVATDERVLLLDKKPMFTRCDELPYRIISGITHSNVWFTSNVVLHTRTGDIHLRTFNTPCARNFTHAIEIELSNRDERRRYDTTINRRYLPAY